MVFSHNLKSEHLKLKITFLSLKLHFLMELKQNSEKKTQQNKINKFFQLINILYFLNMNRLGTRHKHTIGR